MYNRRKFEVTFICGQFDDLEMAEISELDHFFLISVGTLVLLLQSGYAFLEAGAVRSKNAVNICLRYATHLAIQKYYIQRISRVRRFICIISRCVSFLQYMYFLSTICECKEALRKRVRCLFTS